MFGALFLYSEYPCFNFIGIKLMLIQIFKIVKTGDEQT